MQTKKITLIFIVLLLVSCGGSKSSIDLDCEMVGKKIEYDVTQMAYLSDFGERSVDEVTKDIGRWLVLYINKKGRPNRDLKQFDLKITPIKDKTFEIIGCYKITSYGYMTAFAPSYKGYILNDSINRKSTILETSEFKI